MMFFINNDDWYIILLVASGVLLGKLAYSIFSGILKGIIEFVKEKSKLSGGKE